MPSDAVDVNEMGLEPADLAHLAGAPFTQAEINGAVTTVRNAAKWHIAPEITSIVVLDVVCMEPLLRLPTRYLVEVSEVRDLDTDTVIAATRYRVSRAFGQIRYRCGYWPSGYERVQVEFDHGYETVPADLLPVIAEAALLQRRDQTAKTQTAGPYSTAFDISLAGGSVNPMSTGAVLERYRLWQPGIS
ncbi:hypothetical protein LAUMK4_05836 [Mycobacterium persicum]|uniref:Uncharacterized protein n=1 Tax=Mycobacterium persicum TaxID=1487726 RepID=A0ABY6RSH0_9MYCO|nr:hypothetical protein [Mycobacterium persicum]ORB93958.1 hypothetical protein B1T44_04795 [Mycobacterium persicum]VAZ77469.1 hypothetical protein LAUMK15_03841 [Mycobacterium persicum]VBA32966.1 hypothetical protein LAUMK4_05836 [Mycobacterium persicum]